MTSLGLAQEISVLADLPRNGESVLAFGYRTFCCSEDKEDERKWHEVKFYFKVCAYKLKKQLPEDIEDTVIESLNWHERWEIVRGGDIPTCDHLIGVTKWKELKKVNVV